jgi:hypothetical protein
MLRPSAIAQKLSTAYYKAGVRISPEAYPPLTAAETAGLSNVYLPTKHLIDMAGLMALTYVMSDIAAVRYGLLHGLENVTDSLGNVVHSLPAGVWGAGKAGRKAEEHDCSPAVIRGATILGALAASTAANAIGETPFMSALYAGEPGEGRVDRLDFGVGVATGTAMAAFIATAPPKAPA